MLVICELLGVPYADRDRFRAWTRDAADIRDRTRSERGLAKLFGDGQHLVARKRAEPGDDIVSRLCATPGTGEVRPHASLARLHVGDDRALLPADLRSVVLERAGDPW